MRKNPWLENSVENLLPLSVANDFREALKEWGFTGDVIDHGDPIETCELCEHEELRYHYEIENDRTNNSLWVGSSCILRFEDIVVLDENDQLLTSVEERKAQLAKSLKERQVDIMLEPLRTLWKLKRPYRIEIEWQVNLFKRNGGFEPEYLAKLFERLNGSNIEFKPAMFPLYLRTIDSRFQLTKVSKNTWPLIWKAMSPSQRKKYVKINETMT